MLRRYFPLLLLLLLACDHEEPTNPEMKTNDTQEIGKTSMVIEGEIYHAGSIRPIRYGFLWDTVGNINIYGAAHKVDLGTSDTEKKFSIKLEDLNPNTVYFIKSYAANMDYTKVYYGNEITTSTLAN